MSEINFDHIGRLALVQEADEANVRSKDASYGASWKKRGGIGAFMMAARKWDRLEGMMERGGFDIFAAVEAQRGEAQGTDGTVIAEIRDLRRYLLLIEAEMVARGAVEIDAMLSDYRGAEALVPKGQEEYRLHPVHKAAAQSDEVCERLYADGDIVRMRVRDKIEQMTVESAMFDAQRVHGWYYTMVDGSGHIYRDIPQPELRPLAFGNTEV